MFVFFCFLTFFFFCRPHPPSLILCYQSIAMATLNFILLLFHAQSQWTPALTLFYYRGRVSMRQQPLQVAEKGLIGSPSLYTFSYSDLFPFSNVKIFILSLADYIPFSNKCQLDQKLKEKYLYSGRDCEYP